MSVTRNVWLPALLFAMTVCGPAIRCDAEELSADEAAALQEVLESVRKNDAAIKAFHAIEEVHVGPFGFEFEPAKSENDGSSSLILEPIPEDGVTKRFDIWFDGLNERSEVEETGELFMWHDGITTTHWPSVKQADIYHSKHKSVVGSEDPRFIGFRQGEGGLLSILTGNTDGWWEGNDVHPPYQIHSARRIDRDGQNLVVIEAKKPNAVETTVIECDAAISYLPTRVYDRGEDGDIHSVTDIEYSRVAEHRTPVWFPNRAVTKHAFPHHIKSPDAEEWGQTVTISIKQLEMDPEVPKDLFDIPEFPEGTVVHDGIEETTYKVGEQQER